MTTRCAMQLWAIALVVAGCAAETTPAIAEPATGDHTRISVPADETASFVVLWDPSSAPKPESALWLAYLMYRVEYRIKEAKTQPPYGIQTPTFDEEVWARNAATQTYLELRRKDPELDVRYFDDLSRVRDAGFLREYVWIFLNQGRWNSEPHDLRKAEFDDWRSVHLAGHRAATYGEISLERR